MRIVLIFVAALLGFCPAMAQDSPAAGATIVYHFERPGLPLPTYEFTLHEDGSGSYRATYIATATAPATETTTPITLTASATAKLFQQIRGTDHFRNRCESKAKNVADTGTKTIHYSGADGQASCTYNYTENKAIAGVTETFAAISETMDFGRRLEFDHRYDRLGLDADMTTLVAAVKDKSVIEVQTIAPALQSIAGDGAVIERVRVAAGKLLQLGATGR